MTCSNCGYNVEANTQFCNHCGSPIQSPMQAAPPMQQEHPPQPMHQMQPGYPMQQSYTPARHRLPGAGILLVAGIGNLIVGAIFIFIGLGEISALGMVFASLMWVIFGAIIIGDGVRTIMQRNNFDKIAELRSAMIVGSVILGVALIYFIFTGTLGLFFILIIVPDILGLIGAQMNHSYAQRVNAQNQHNPPM